MFRPAPNIEELCSALSFSITSSLQAPVFFFFFFDGDCTDSMASLGMLPVWE